jgi:hypothetical protein
MTFMHTIQAWKNSWDIVIPIAQPGWDYMFSQVFVVYYDNNVVHKGMRNHLRKI